MKVGMNSMSLKLYGKGNEKGEMGTGNGEMVKGNEV